MSIAAMKQALDALEQSFIIPNSKLSPLVRDKTITALRAAIAEQEKAEPVAWKYQVGSKVHLETHRLDHYYWYNGSYVKGTPIYAYPAPAPVPAGWQLVPVEPTEAMIRASHGLASVVSYSNGQHAYIPIAYKAMIAAAPKEMK
jgi:hypothetical protein